MNAMYNFNTTVNGINKEFQLIPFNKNVASWDDEKYYRWFYDQEVTKYNSHGLFPQTPESYESFFNSIGKNNVILAIIDINPLIHIGNISLQSINWINRSAEFAIVMGEKDYWGCGIGEKAGKILIEHGFKKLGLNRIWTGTASTNVGMRKLAGKLGMEKEGIFSEGMFLEGRFVDVSAYGITKSEWETLQNEESNTK